MNIAFVSTEMDAWALGLRSISAVLTAAGHETQLVLMRTNERHFSERNLAELTALVRQADVIGIGCLAQGSAKARQLIQSLRALNKLIVWGGVHASLNPAECADWADIVCRGEGEEMMLELLERLEQGRDWRDIKNVAFKEDGVLKQNDVRPPIADLDALPLPDFSFANEYHLTQEGLVKVSTAADVGGAGQIIFNSSRGCAFHCTYCCNRKLKELYSRKDRYVRRMSVSRLIAHTKYLRKAFPQAKYFYFIDEDFGARPLEELLQLAQEFPEQVGLPFACLTHPAQVSRQKMDLLVKAGLFRIYLGIESGSERTRREIYDRHVSNETVLRAAHTISRYKQVFPTYFFILANPYEEREDLTATARLIAQLPHGSYAIMYNLVFFPGSALYEQAVTDRMIEGVHDCGHELNFLGGLNYRQHSWKEKNLYLNGLIFLMDGHSTRYRIGLLPRLAIGPLLDPHFVAFNENHLSAIKLMIQVKFLSRRARHSAARLLRTIFRNPAVVHNLGYYLRIKRFSTAQQPDTTGI